MAKLSTEELLDAFKEMTLLELSEFVKQFEDVFDVKAAAPAAMMMAARSRSKRLPLSRTSKAVRCCSRSLRAR